MSDGLFLPRQLCFGGGQAKEVKFGSCRVFGSETALCPYMWMSQASRNILALPSGCHSDLIYHFTHRPFCMSIISSNGSTNVLAWVCLGSGFKFSGLCIQVASSMPVKFINKYLRITNIHFYVLENGKRDISEARIFKIK